MFFTFWISQISWVGGVCDEIVDGLEMLADEVFSHSVTPPNNFHDERLQ